MVSAYVCCGVAISMLLALPQQALYGALPCVQDDRVQIGKSLEHGEELLARFRHWEPIISE